MISRNQNNLLVNYILMSFKFLLIAGFSDSLIAFRKPLIVTLLDKVLDVHVAAPELSVNKDHA